MLLQVTVTNAGTAIKPAKMHTTQDLPPPQALHTHLPSLTAVTWFRTDSHAQY